jgi:hypothetical protein
MNKFIKLILFKPVTPWKMEIFHGQAPETYTGDLVLARLISYKKRVKLLFLLKSIFFQMITFCIRQLATF